MLCLARVSAGDTAAFEELIGAVGRALQAIASPWLAVVDRASLIIDLGPYRIAQLGDQIAIAEVFRGEELFRGDDPCAAAGALARLVADGLIRQALERQPARQIPAGPAQPRYLLRIDPERVVWTAADALIVSAWRPAPMGIEWGEVHLPISEIAIFAEGDCLSIEASYDLLADRRICPYARRIPRGVSHGDLWRVQVEQVPPRLGTAVSPLLDRDRTNGA